MVRNRVVLLVPSWSPAEEGAACLLVFPEPGFLTGFCGVGVEHTGKRSDFVLKSRESTCVRGKQRLPVLTVQMVVLS